MKMLTLLVFGSALSFSVNAEQQKIIESGQKEGRSVTQRVYEGAREVIRENCDADCRSRSQQIRDDEQHQNNGAPQLGKRG